MKAKHHQKDDQRKSECNQSDDNIRKAIERSFLSGLTVCVLFIKARERFYDGGRTSKVFRS